MKFLKGVFVLAVLVCGVAVYHHGFALTPQPQSTSPKAQPSATPPAHLNPNQEINNRFVKNLSEKIAGRENEPAVMIADGFTSAIDLELIIAESRTTTRLAT